MSGSNRPMARLGGQPATRSGGPFPGSGYPWIDGDMLFAADLNAAFLPAAGGAINGPLTVNGVTTFNGASTFNGDVTASSVYAAKQGASQPATFICVDGAGTQQGGMQYISSLGELRLFNSTGGGAITIGSSDNIETSGPLTVDGAATVSGPLTVAGTSTLNGAATVGGPLTVNGVSTFNGNVRITSVCAAWAGVSQPATFVCADSSGTPQGGVEYIPALASFSLFNSVGGANLQLGTANNLLFSGATASKPGGGAWADSSDARIKTVESDYKAGLAEVVSLRPVWFRYRGNDAPPDQPSPHAATMGRPFVGLIAQEAETVLPELVSAGPGFVDGQPVDDLRSLDPSALIYALVNAVKTLADRLAALEGGAPACPA